MDVYMHLLAKTSPNIYIQIHHVFLAIYFFIKILKIKANANKIVVIGFHPFYSKMVLVFNAKINLIVTKFPQVHKNANAYFTNHYQQTNNLVKLKVNSIKIVY